MSQSQPVENPAEQMKSGKEGKKSVIDERRFMRQEQNVNLVWVLNTQTEKNIF